MKIFSGFGAFAEHLLAASACMAESSKASLEIAAQLVQKEAKAEIGHLQPEAGPFNEWDELADSTKAEKERLGFGDSGNDWQPLLRTGELRESIKYEVSAFEAVIGSTSPIMAFQEFGTPTIPPRPVLGPAAFKNKEKIKAIIGKSTVSALTYGKVVHTSLGYDMEI